MAQYCDLRAIILIIGKVVKIYFSVVSTIVSMMVISIIIGNRIRRRTVRQWWGKQIKNQTQQIKIIRNQKRERLWLKIITWGLFNGSKITKGVVSIVKPRQKSLRNY